VQAFESRRRLEGEYETEQEDMARPGFGGRRFLEASRIAEALRLRRSGVCEADIEAKLGIGKGGLGLLGKKGVVDIVS
jgi:hypothetical protein